MAAKTTRKQGSGSRGKKAASAGGKKSPAAAGKKRGAAKNKGAAPMAKKGAAALAPTKHENLRLGLQKKSRPPRVFITNGVTKNVFLVFGDSIGVGSVNRKRVSLNATHHLWNPPSRLRNSGSDALEITATCGVRVAAKRGHYTDDDLTVTLTLDPTTINPDTTDCTFEDVEYDA